MSGGTIKKDARRGKWYFVVDLPSADGSRKQARRRGFTTKKAAQDALDELRGAVATGTYVDPTTITLGEYLTDLWLPSLPGKVRATTADTYGRLVAKHIIPTLGEARLQKLERARVRRWLDDLVA